MDDVQEQGAQEQGAQEQGAAGRPADTRPRDGAAAPDAGTHASGGGAQAHGAVPAAPVTAGAGRLSDGDSADGHPAQPKMYRRRGGRALAGVAGGLADHLGVKVLWVRIAFAVLAGLGGLGVLTYGLLWAFVPQERRDTSRAELSGRQRQQAYGLIALGVGLTVVGGVLSGVLTGWAGLPVAVVLVGVAVVWREADETQRRRWRKGARSGVAGVVFGGGGVSATVRVLAGVVLVVAGIGLIVLRGSGLAQLQFAVVAVLATLIGVALLTVPFWLRLVRDLGDERRARIRTEERAEIAAHLHDSVLQTLALIQKRSDHPREVTRLARGQERQLRAWLYGPNGYGTPNRDAGAPGSDGPGEAESAPATLAQAVAEACGQVEDTFAISVQQVVVGDVELDDGLVALVQAAREAIVNAAKHAGVDEVSVYAEVEPTAVTAFVRDRGAGFDPDAVPDDRHGLSDSIRGRMERGGGSCRVRTAPGEGTEIQLEMPRAAGTAGGKDTGAGDNGGGDTGGGDTGGGDTGGGDTGGGVDDTGGRGTGDDSRGTGDDSGRNGGGGRAAEDGGRGGDERGSTSGRATHDRAAQGAAS
ncbi:phage shock protein C (PspC) family protein [Prauserella aidingensis]|uniref:PspC domain-containing protein n=1 Tax=Prauserella aidingensis TaxID=387890 RepID=UPI003555FEA7|nr:phage shock protein C (PspC) family protein [Prauserella aidingensis]